MRNALCRSLLMTVCLLMLAAPALGMGGYKELLWIDAPGYAVHVMADGSTTLTTFLRYREVRLEKNTRKPGHFVCTQDGVLKQVPVRDISSVKLALSAEDLAKTARQDRFRRLIMTMKNGESFKVWVEHNMAYALSNEDYLELKYWDPASQEFRFGGFNGTTLREIRFN